jgi:hypothetical protein
MYLSTHLSGRLLELGRRPLFTVEGMTYSWGDVLAWAAARGTLEELSQRSRRGLTCVRGATERRDEIDPEELSAEASRFRYGRSLLSAEELNAWLRRWNVTVHEWGGYLERCLMLDRHLEDDDPPPEDAEAAHAEFVDALYVDAVSSGFLEREALGFVADAALADLTPVEAAGDRTVMVERTLAAAALARASAVSELGLEREIARRGFDWTRLELDMLELSEEGAAREAALCMRVEGRELAQVAAACRAEVARLTAYLVDLEPWLQPSLVSAQPGELVGPVEEGDGFVLLAVRERDAAAATDPELRRRAEIALVERAVRRATEERVVWHEHF